MSKFKTKREYEEEDSLNYRRRLENVQRRKDIRRAEGFKCKAEGCGCGQIFETKLEYDEHIKKHQDELRKAMKCNKEKCKDVKVGEVQACTDLNIDNDNVSVFSSEVVENIISTLRNTSRRPSRK